MPFVKLIADNAIKDALKKSKLANSDFEYVVSTGCGRHSVPFANKALSEIICHAKAAKFLIPSTRTIIDIGGQDSKIIILDESGGVANFLMNDKCAAGTGRFQEVMANALDVALKEMGKISLMSQDPCSITGTCTVFAETEVVALRGQGKARKDLIAGIHSSVASRVYILGKRIGYAKYIVFTGGVAKNVGVRRALKRLIGIETLTPAEPQTVGVLVQPF